MKTHSGIFWLLIIASGGMLVSVGDAAPLATAFTYQGRLVASERPATGLYEMRFGLFSANTGGASIGPVLTTMPVAVSNGLFTTTLDFGAGIFDGSLYWLQMGVRTNGDAAAFRVLLPRQRLTAVPYSLYTPNAGMAATAMTASNLTGTVANQQLPLTVARLNSNQTFTGSVNFMPASGRIGIGTLSPQETLSISGGLNVDQNALNNGEINPGIKFGSSSGEGIASKRTAGANQYGLDFYTGFINRMTIQNNGNVGIGTISPAHKLSVAGNIGWSNSELTHDQGGSIELGNPAVTNMTPYIDFHRGGVPDFNVRLINDANGQLTLRGNLYIDGALQGGSHHHDSTYWKLNGNSGTLTNSHFLGTTDNQQIEFRVNSAPALRIVPTTSVANFIGGLNAIQPPRVTAGVRGAVVAGGGAPSGGVTGFGGGDFHQVSDSNGAIGGGFGNKVGNDSGTVDDAAFATVAGGVFNSATHYAATVSGGDACVASGLRSAVPGGYANTAAGDYSFAAGFRAKANHAGAFVWADPINFDFTSTTTNEFSVRASGGARFVTGLNDFGSPVTGVQLTPGSGSWSSLSDRSAKGNFAPVDCGDVLDRVATLPISTWNYRSQDTSIRHIGPTAQDFVAAFAVGEDDRHIATVDADGVALAAIQGLHSLVRDQDTQLKAQQQEIRELRERLAAVEKLVEQRAQK